MSYLGTLVNTPAAAAAPRRAEPAFEQHVQIESSASLPVSVASEAVAAAPQQRQSEQAHTAPVASVEDALRAAFEWVTPRSAPPAITAETEMPASSTRSAALEVLTQSAAAPMEASQAQPQPQAPQSLERNERTLALPALNASSETVELTSFESMTPTPEPKPHRRAVAASRAFSPEAAAAEQEPPARAQPVQVRIGTISLNVRTPTPPAPPAPPAPKAAAPVLAPAPARPAPSAAFAFSARRHHLRWG